MLLCAMLNRSVVSDSFLTPWTAAALPHPTAPTDQIMLQSALTCAQQSQMLSGPPGTWLLIPGH